eukprot:14898178-Alexandrium_andersonii.AAC.1
MQLASDEEAWGDSDACAEAGFPWEPYILNISHELGAADGDTYGTCLRPVLRLADLLPLPHEPSPSLRPEAEFYWPACPATVRAIDDLMTLDAQLLSTQELSLIHISEPTRLALI